MTRDEYILKRLSKIAHKKWELFVVTRILHRLDDPEIEFVCQQKVRRKGGGRGRGHTDLYFPQFALHLEIDERQHANEDHRKRDLLREQDIVDATGHEIERIVTYTDDGKSDRSLLDVARDTDHFIERLRRKKENLLAEGRFVVWDFEGRYRPEKHIERGYLDIADNVIFKYQHDALRCFGYTGKKYQHGTWAIPSDPSRVVWFPRLYPDKDWDNRLSDDEYTITERRFSGFLIDQNSPNSYPRRHEKRVTFARFRDELGTTIYRFVGEFHIDRKASSAKKGVFRRVASRIDTIRPYDPNEKFGGEFNATLAAKVQHLLNEGKLKVSR